MTPRLLAIAIAAIGFAGGAVRAEAPPTGDDAKLEFFEKKVRPVLAANCYNCHSANTKALSGLRVDDRNGLLTGGKRGPAIVPGDAEKSRLIQAVKHTLAKASMPPEKTLSADEIADLSRWIKEGAAWPKVALPKSIGRSEEKYKQLRKEHWAFQPLRDPQAPTVKDAAWPKGDIDRFVLAGLEKKGLRPVGDAERIDLIRRVTFDLTGLPPTAGEIDAFLADQAPDAFEKVVDRLLASTAYGERWGRHWLDVARFGESTGSARNLPYPHAWRYRDWVIDAVTKDLPYDEFVRQQVAGDLMPAASDSERDAHNIATGFLAMGVQDVNQRFKVRFDMDNVDEQIDTVSRSFLALTASCARCHDHKFDPIPVTDYYGLAGIFRSTEVCNGLKNKMGGGGLDYYVPEKLLHVSGGKKLDSETLAKIEEARKEAAEAKAAFEKIKGTPEGKKIADNGKPAQFPFRQKMLKTEAALVALEGTGTAAMGVRDYKEPADTEIRVRGQAEDLGPVAPRGYLTAFAVPGAPPVNPKQSGRLELAAWLTSDKNPLISRVMVNRVWKHLFGTGIVSSVDNFGTTGAAPSDADLLDHLANRFVKDGWSVKRLVRTLVLTRAYRLGSDSIPANLTADPENRLVWRHSPRRLDAEEIRDAMLAVAGTLDRSHRTGSAAAELQIIEMRNNGPEAQRIENAAETSLSRSVYLPLLRTLTPRSMEVFDFAEQGMVTGSRDTTTVATQALFLLNDRFVQNQATSLAKDVRKIAAADDAERIRSLYRRSLGRLPTEQEIDRATTFLAEYESAARESQTAEPRNAAWASFCQAVLASAEFRYLR
jgi:Protein of unknown function (DUF1553)/Protein of unknown function (DUF1549)/Planctomycete cytochrome C